MRIGIAGLGVTSALLVACGASTPPGPPGPGGGAGNGTATGANNSDSCPAAYASVPNGQACPDAVGAECAFAEGRCTCAGQSYCGGVEPDEETLASLAKPVWQCTPVRTDGCPEQVPTGACSTDGQQCGYGDCCHQLYSCDGGTWTAGQMSCPP